MSIIDLFFNRRSPIIQTPEQILYDAAYPILMAPWHGIMTPVQIRELTMAQALSCGEFGLIETWEQKLRSNKQPTVEEMNSYAERHHQICRLAMVKPTYNEAMKIAGAHIDSDDVDKRLKEIKELWKTMPQSPERVSLKKEYDALEIACKFLLPTEFTAYIVNYSLGIDKSDIKKVTEEMLKNAAVLATRGHDNPHDHIGGVFTDLMQREIDNRAWVLFDAEQKKLQRGIKR